MLNKLCITLLATIGMFIPFIASAQVYNPSFWYLNGSQVTTLSPTYGLTVTSLANIPCLGTDNTGKFIAGTCSGGGGGSATTTINGVLGPVFTFATSTGIQITSSTGILTFSNTGVTSFNGGTGAITYSPSTTIPTAYVSSFNGATGTVIYSSPATTTINGVQSSTFYIIGTGAITSTVQGATTTFSFINPGYITSAPATTTINGVQSSTFHIVGDNVGITSTVSGATTTFSLINPGWITTSSIKFGGVQSSTFQVGTGLTMSASGTLVVSGGFITTSTFNSTGTASYFPVWNPSGNLLTPTSTLFQSSTMMALSFSTTTIMTSTLNLGNSAVNTGQLYIDGAPQVFANPIVINGQTPKNFIYIDNTYNALRIGAQTGGVSSIDFELPGAAAYTDVMSITTSTLAPAATFDNVMALGFATNRWNSLFIGTGTATFQGNVSTTIANALLAGNSNGIIAAYGGSSCAGGKFATSVSVTGTVICSTPIGSATTTINQTVGPNFTFATSTGIQITTTTGQLTFSNTGVTSFNGGTGAITYSSVGTTTINGISTSTFNIIGDGTTISSTVVGATTTFRSLVTSSSLGVYTNTNQLTNGAGFLANASITANSPITWSVGNVIGFNNPGFVTAASSVIWTANQTFNTTSTFASNIVLASTTLCNGNLNALQTNASGTVNCGTIVLPAGMATTTINQVIGPTFTFTTSTGIQITTSSGQLAFSNTGVTSFNGNTGAVTYSSPATTTINGITTSTFVFAAAGPGLTVASSGFTITYTYSSSTLNLGLLSTFTSTSSVLAGYATSSNITGGSCTNCNITYNGNGIITVATNGSGSGFINANASSGIAITTSSALISIQNIGVTSFNGSTGTVTYSSPATSTIIASGTTVTGPSFTFSSTTIIQPYVSGTAFYWAFVNPGFVTLASSSFVTTTTQITAGGTATGNAFTFATSTSANTFNINCTVATCTFTIPPKNDQYFAPSTTIPTNDNQLVNGAGFVAAGSSTTWTALNTFNGGVVFNTSTTWTQLPPTGTSTALLAIGSSTQNNPTTSTFIGINTTSSWVGDFFLGQVNSSTKIEISSTGTIIVSGNGTFNGGLVNVVAPANTTSTVNVGGTSSAACLKTEDKGAGGTSYSVTVGGIFYTGTTQCN